MRETIRDLVSVITPVHNRPAMLRDAVESVLRQTWQAFEIIISDDGSTDETTEVGKAYERDHPGVVRYLWNPNRGAGPAREAGRLLATGEFIQYLDSDDTLWPRKFEIQVDALRRNPEAGAAYGYIRLCPVNAPPIERPHKWSGRVLPTLFPWLLVDRWWNTDCPLWRRSVCDAIGPWTDLRYSQDWEYDARAGALGTKLVHCAEFVCDQRHHEELRQTGSGKWLAPADRVMFFSSLYGCAVEAGVKASEPEMQHFARWVFLNSRSCGIAGDAQAARQLLSLATRAIGRSSLDMLSFRAIAAILGWERTARLSEWIRGRVRSAPGQRTLKQSWMETKVDEP